jgi:glycosyltransferase involved in cell wall biosynthesis
MGTLSTAGTSLAAKPSVAIVVEGGGEGGAVARVALEHAAGLAERFCVTVLSDSLPAGPAPQNVEMRLVRVHAFRFLRRFGHAVRAVFFARKAAAVLSGIDRRRHIDFVWCHSHGVAAGLAASGFGGRVGMTVHGDIFERPPATYDPLLTAWYRFSTPRAYARCRWIQALNAEAAGAVQRRGARPECVFVLPNGISRQDFPADLSPVERETGRVLYVGRLSVEKGCLHLLRAMEEVRNAKLDIVGDGPQRKICEAFAADKGLAVTFHDARPRPELAGFYRRASLMCSPSLDEQFSTVLLEAMLFGLPVVATAVGGTPSIVCDGSTGRLVPPGDPSAMARAISEVIGNPQLAREWGNAGLLRVRKEFFWPDICRRLADRIQTAIVE